MKGEGGGKEEEKRRRRGEKRRRRGSRMSICDVCQARIDDRQEVIHKKDVFENIYSFT